MAQTDYTPKIEKSSEDPGVLSPHYSMGDGAMELAIGGWSVFPCRADKRPYTKNGFHDATCNLGQVSDWWQKWPEALIGLPCFDNGVLVIDLDRKDGRDGVAALESLVQAHGEEALQVGPMQSTRSNGYHLFFRHPEREIPSTANKVAPGVDVRSHAYVIVSPSPGYAWEPDHGLDANLTDLPAWLLDLIAQPERIESEAPKIQPSNQNGRAGEKWLPEALDRANTGNRNDTGHWLADQLWADGLSDGEIKAVPYPEQVTQADHPYTRREWEATVESVARQPRREPARGVGKLKETPDMDEQAGWLPFDAVKEAYYMGEAGDATLFKTLYEGQFVYDHAESTWHKWNGHYWQADKTDEVFHLVTHKIAAQYLHAAAEARRREIKDLPDDLMSRASSLRNKTRVVNVMYAAARYKNMKVIGDEWDLNPYLLACENGVIDLRTGEISDGKPSDYIRAHAPTEWKGLHEPAPKWAKFLLEVLSDDTNTVEFVQRLLGYGVSGLRRERIFPIFYGKGQNGKGTLLEAVYRVLGADIAMPTEADSLMDTGKGQGNAAQPYKYALRGKRLVWASETKEGGELDLAMMKLLSGGDTLTARTLHGKPVTWTPTHQIVLLTNHKPRVSAEDAAAWFRLVLVGFPISFVKNPSKTKNNERKADEMLDDTLKVEAPGILAWLVRGFLDWQENGMSIPEKVAKATEEYRSEEDTLSNFLDECCRINALASVTAGVLYQAYVKWAEQSGIKPVYKTKFSRQITDHGYSVETKPDGKPDRDGAGRSFYLGIGLLDNQDPTNKASDVVEF